jgi:hypothetical protein
MPDQNGERGEERLIPMNVFRYNLGLSKREPKFAKFNYAEKMEYWAFLWAPWSWGFRASFFGSTISRFVISRSG